MPSTWNVVSRPSEPCTVRSRFCMPEVPPTSGSASRAPGSSAPSVGMLRPVGTASSTCRLSTTCCTAFCTSTTGEAPETVTVSSSAPTRRSALMVAVKLARQFDAVALHGVEAGQRERDRVDAWAQIHDLVLALTVADDRADLFDQRGARDFDGHAGHHRPGGVLDHAGNRALRASDGRPACHTYKSKNR